MPFTFSHPAIVLPLKNIFGKWVSLTGLIIGSLTPDFEYFIRMKIQSSYSHTITGTLWFNLPLGILLCFAFHNIVKRPLIENTPNFIQSRMTIKQNWIIVSLSIIIGAYSHIFWDSFTHSNTFFTNSGIAAVIIAIILASLNEKRITDTNKICKSNSA